MLSPERLLFMHVSMSSQERTLVTIVTQQHTAPIVDQERNMPRPVHFCHFFEYRREDIVEDNLTVEVHHDVMDPAAAAQVLTAGLCRALQRGSLGFRRLARPS